MTALEPRRGGGVWLAIASKRKRVQPVTGLKKDDDGIWRGQAVRGGTSVPVFCDYQGNVGAS